MESNHLCIQRLHRLFSGLEILALAKGLTQHWCSQQVSNMQPPAYKAGALPLNYTSNKTLLPTNSLEALQTISCEPRNLCQGF